jgi:hypothetical protein
MQGMDGVTDAMRPGHGVLHDSKEYREFRESLT